MVLGNRLSRLRDNAAFALVDLFPDGVAEAFLESGLLRLHPKGHGTRAKKAAQCMTLTRYR